MVSSSLGTGISRILGLVRELAVAHAVGAGVASDAWTTAFTIPGVFRRFMADEGLTGALVPEIDLVEAEKGDEAARRLAGRVLTALVIFGSILCGLGVFFAEPLVHLFAQGFTADPEKFDLTVQLTRITMFFAVLVSIVSWAEGLLNQKGHFFIPKLAPGLVSAAIVIAAMWPGMDDPYKTIQAVAWAAMVGGVAHVLICIPPLVKAWGRIQPRFDWSVDPHFQHMLSEMGKVMVIGLTAQINIIVLRRVASFLQTGAPTWYWNASRMVDFAQGIIAVGVGSALLPLVSKAVAREDWDGFQHAFVGSARLVAGLLLPAAVFIAVLAMPVVAFLYRHGEYTMSDVEHTASALRWLVPYMIGLAGIQIVKKPFFALGDRTPLIGVALLGVVLTAVLGTVLGKTMGVDGLSLALSVSTVGQLIAYLVLLRGRVGAHLGLRQIADAYGRLALACVPLALIGGGLGLLGQWELGPTLRNGAILAAAGGIGGLVYAWVAAKLGVDEVGAILRAAKRKAGMS